jgi:cytochrome c5
LEIAKMKPSYFGYSLAALAALIASLSFPVRSATAGDKPTGAAPGAAPGVATAPVGKSAAQLWAEQCQRCHNVRSPSSYSAAQWEVAMLHMRIRANLTPEQQKKILEFLKSSS